MISIRISEGPPFFLHNPLIYDTNRDFQQPKAMSIFLLLAGHKTRVFVIFVLNWSQICHNSSPIQIVSATPD